MGFSLSHCQTRIGSAGETLTEMASRLVQVRWPKDLVALLNQTNMCHGLGLSSHVLNISSLDNHLRREVMDRPRDGCFQNKQWLSLEHNSAALILRMVYSWLLLGLPCTLTF